MQLISLADGGVRFSVDSFILLYIFLAISFTIEKRNVMIFLVMKNTFVHNTKIVDQFFSSKNYSSVYVAKDVDQFLA